MREGLIPVKAGPLRWSSVTAVTCSGERSDTLKTLLAPPEALIAFMLGCLMEKPCNTTRNP
jgi:hypothetical protein